MFSAEHQQQHKCEQQQQQPGQPELGEQQQHGDQPQPECRQQLQPHVPAWQEAKEKVNFALN